MPTVQESNMSIRPNIRSMFSIHVFSFFVMIATTYVSSNSLFFDRNRNEEPFGRRFFVILPTEVDRTIRSQHFVFISSRSRNLVQVNITKADKSWFGPKFTIQPDIIANVTIDLGGSINYPFSKTGVAIQIDASDDVAVWVIPKRNDTVLGGYRAIPYDALGKLYVGVLYPAAATYTSEMVLFSAAAPINEVELLHEPTNGTVTMDDVTNVLPRTIKLQSMSIVKIMSLEDLSGLQISGIEALSVTSSRHCRPATSTSPADQCTNIMEQLPPLDVWGQTFIIVPQITAGPSTLKLRVVSAISNTNVTTFTPSGEVSETWNMSNDIDVRDVDITVGRPLTIRSDKPIMVTQFFTNGRRRLDYAAMTNIPPVEQFTNSTVVFPVLDHRNFTNILIITTRCEHREDILLNNKQLTDEWQFSVRFNVEPKSTVHGTYCTLNKTLKSGSHALSLRNDANIGAAYAALLYGIGYSQAYAYQVAADMRELVCDIRGEEVDLCQFYVPPDYVTPTPSNNITSVTSQETQKRSGPNHSIVIIVVIVILSIAALIIIIIIVFANWKDKSPKVTWRRLKNAREVHYDASLQEDNVDMDEV